MVLHHIHNVHIKITFYLVSEDQNGTQALAKLDSSLRNARESTSEFKGVIKFPLIVFS